MFRLEEGFYLWLLLLLPLLGVLLLWYRRRREAAIAQLGGAAAVKRIAPGLEHTLRNWAPMVLGMGLAILIFAIANPQWGTRRQTVERKGVELFIALDISNSMLCEDVLPSRLERAKRFAQQLVDELEGDRMGLVLFACAAFPAAPLTTDYSFLQQVLITANPDQAGEQGTSLSAAIDRADANFSLENKSNRAIILITDGEDHDQKGAELAATVREKGVLTFAVGVGTEAGGFVPDPGGNGSGNYLRDDSGSPVRSQLQPETLKKLAEAGGGAYYNLQGNPKQVAANIRDRINSLDKQTFEQQLFTEHESYFQPFLLLALLLLALEWWWSGYKPSTEEL